MTLDAVGAQCGLAAEQANRVGGNIDDIETATPTLGDERDTVIAQAANRTARAGATVAMQQAERTRAALAQSFTMADSLATYPPLVVSLEQQLAATYSARLGYREERDEERQRSGELPVRIAADSTLLAQYRDERRQIVAGPPVSGSSWGCAAGVTITTVIRSGAGLGITCGRRLR